MDEALEAIASAMTERELYECIRETALTLGWLLYHTYDSRRSYPGFPDVVLVRPPQLILAELKRERGEPSPQQERWLEALRRVPAIGVYVWRPSDWLSGEIERVLRGERDPR